MPGGTGVIRVPSAPSSIGQRSVLATGPIALTHPDAAEFRMAAFTLLGPMEPAASPSSRGFLKRANTQVMPAGVVGVA